MTRCWGPEPHKHVAGCRRGRALCRWRRLTNPRDAVCRCHAYPFPHRDGAGACRNDAAFEALLRRPRNRMSA
jgi:hypothetical protein